mgnify:CR=1 FL=1
MSWKNSRTISSVHSQRVETCREVGPANPYRNVAQGSKSNYATVREQFWIPRLRSLVKIVHSNCHGCRRFRATAITKPVPGQLPEERTTVGGAFEVIGTDFAGSIRYKRKNNKEGKAYLTIFECSLLGRYTRVTTKFENRNVHTMS